jgi:UDP-N-acetylglucosamine transferase subunit ALG13
VLSVISIQIRACKVFGMMLVTVGSSGFNRVVRLADELKGEGRIRGRLVVQGGRITYKPRHADEFFRFTSWERINELNREARCVISHAGAGCILTALQYGTPFIAVPRLKELGEHNNDHQMEIARTLEGAGKVLVANDKSELEKCLKLVYRGWKPVTEKTGSDLVSGIERFVETA